jgi:hypothetical protein
MHNDYQHMKKKDRCRTGNLSILLLLAFIIQLFYSSGTLNFTTPLFHSQDFWAYVPKTAYHVLGLRCPPNHTGA